MLTGGVGLSTTISENNAVGSPLRFSHFAMATEFVIYVRRQDATYAGQACQAAFNELDRLESEFSRFQTQSDIARIRQLKPGESIVIGVDTFSCLQKCLTMYLDTQGAFDSTVAAFYETWLNPDKTLRHPDREEIERAGSKTGLHHLFLDEASYSVAVDLAGLQLDLGAIGKGYAVDCMAAVLKEWEIDQAFVHGGTSSVLAFGRAPLWTVTISHPLNHKNIYRELVLDNRAIGGSGIQKGRHIIDPRLGRPVEHHLAAWVMAADAASADALSTAFMVMSLAEIEAFCARHSDIQAIICTNAANEKCWFSF
jgi:FAD:protein FMN transferase